MCAAPLKEDERDEKHWSSGSEDDDDGEISSDSDDDRMLTPAEERRRAEIEALVARAIAPYMPQNKKPQ